MNGENMTQTPGTWVVELTAHGPTDHRDEWTPLIGDDLDASEWTALADAVLSGMPGCSVAVGTGTIDVTMHTDAASAGAAVDEIVGQFSAIIGDGFTVDHIEVSSAEEFDRRLEAPAVAAGA